MKIKTMNSKSDEMTEEELLASFEEYEREKEKEEQESKV